jgi:hypothetical protein
MPGLFGDTPQGGGILSGFISNLANSSNPNWQQQQQQLQSTYQALGPLIQQAYPDLPAQHQDALARAATLDPEIRKQITPNLGVAPKFVETGTDPFSGQKNFGIERGGPHPSITAAPIQAPGGGPAQGTTTDQMFNTIEQGKAAGLPMDKLLETVPNSVRGVVKAVIESKSIPSNLPPRGPSRDMVMRLAHAIDPDFDESVMPQRQAFARGMGQTSPSSNGGQKILLNTALQHGAELAEALDELHNTSGPLPEWLPGSGPVANVMNRLKNTGASQGGTVKRVNETAARASGEVGKLYSGSAGGGETERLNTARDFSQTNTPMESAGALEAFRNLIFGKMNALQTARDQVYGAQGENIYPILDPKTKEALDKIDKTIAKLRGGGQQAAPQGIKEGSVAVNKQTGQRIMFKGGQWQPVQ